MKSLPLTVYTRTATRRNRVKKLRREGRVPGIVYGPNIQPRNVEVPARELGKLMHQTVSEHMLVDLTVEGESSSTLTLIHDVQHHSISREVIHVDFHKVDENKHVVVTVPVETVGEARGVKQGGGVLEHVLFEVKVRALPRKLPEFIEIDVADLDVGETLHINDLKVPEGVEVQGDAAIPVVSVAISRADRAAKLLEAKEAEAAAAGGAAAAEEAPAETAKAAD